jgi:transcriptional regulator with XRE-family HTH domain
MNTSRATTEMLPERASGLAGLGERIRTLRQERGVSQADLEKRSGLRRSYISRVEGQQLTPSLEILNRIARALDAELSELFFPASRYRGCV